MKTILVDAMNTLIVNGGVDQKMKDILDKFENRKIILTNANDNQIFKHLQNMPYEMFTLKHNPNKVDGGYYEIFLENFALKANECVYFEHNLSAVDRAKEVGIETFHFDKDKRDLRKLKNFLEDKLLSI